MQSDNPVAITTDFKRGDSTMTTHQMSRRAIVGGAAGMLLLGSATQRALAADTTVGFIYVGPRADFGWNQSHAVAAAQLKQLRGIKVIEEESVSETIAVAKTMESMINLDGASLIFGTSFGYFDPFMVEAAKKYPKVQFRHPTSLWNKDKHPMNLGGYFCYVEQAHYVNGVAAGLSTRSNKIGYIAAKPIALVLRTINTFALGVRKVNPKAEVRLIMTGDWALPVREAEATNALIDAGCDVIACHVDSPKVIVERAEARGAKSCGHNADQSQLAPKGFVTGAELKYVTIYKAYAESLAKGQSLPNLYEGGYDKDMVQSSAFGAGASEAGRRAALAAIDELKRGAPIFVGPIKDNTGKLVIPKTLGLYDPSLWQTNYLVEGVVGSIT
jgi:simple sugar transport system substrate-binding protein